MAISSSSSIKGITPSLQGGVTPASMALGMTLKCPLSAWSVSQFDAKYVPFGNKAKKKFFPYLVTVFHRLYDHLPFLGGRYDQMA
jgi:hypothetical protein